MRNKKDVHDYFNIYGMLFLTAIIAYGAFVTIPHQIEQLSSQPLWNEVFYKEGLAYLNGTLFSNPDEMMVRCNTLLEGSTEQLNQTYIECKNGHRYFITIKKINDSCLENSREIVLKCST